jgi:exosortase/archaeosortase
MRSHSSDSFNSLLAPRIADLPLRRKIVPLLTFVLAVPAGLWLVWSVIAILDPGRGLESAPLSIAVILPMILFVPNARPQALRHWVILDCATLVSIVLGMLGLHFSMRLFAPIVESTLLGELPAKLIGSFVGACIAFGIWLLLRTGCCSAGRRAPQAFGESLADPTFLDRVSECYDDSR